MQVQVSAGTGTGHSHMTHWVTWPLHPTVIAFVELDA